MGARAGAQHRAPLDVPKTQRPGQRLFFILFIIFYDDFLENNEKWEGQGFLYNCAQRSVDKTRCFEVVEGNYSQSDQTENYFFYNTIYTLMFSAMQSDYEAK